jgi:hypothetical protein
MLFGTDWPITTPRRGFDDLERHLALPADAYARLCENVAPWLPSARNAGE